MIKKAIIAVVVIVTAAAMVFAAGSADHDNSASNSEENHQNSAHYNGDVSDKPDEKAVISGAEAKKMAEKYIEEPGASAGTPKLIKQSGKLVYMVPVIMNGENVGEIYLNAQTGKNMGGAGGVP